MSIRSATSELLRASGPRLLELRPNVVIVLAESWGEMQDAASRKAFMDFYQRREILQHYTVESGSVPFAGMTLAGETRELCSTTLGTGVMSATAAQLRGCLPTVFKEHGYHTMAVHGFSPHMFHRAQWYPNMAFSRQVFAPELRNDGLKDCAGAFEGVCDADIAAWLGAQLKHAEAKQPLFAHWVTLNSHLPVPSSVSFAGVPSCGSVSTALYDGALCSWFQLVGNLHRSVAELAADPALPPTAFVIVGDHAPPFNSASRRKLFSQTSVPFVLLMPRSSSAANSPSRSDSCQRR